MNGAVVKQSIFKGGFKPDLSGAAFSRGIRSPGGDGYAMRSAVGDRQTVMHPGDVLSVMIQIVGLTR
jgi:hypothetical protein